MELFGAGDMKTRIDVYEWQRDSIVPRKGKDGVEKVKPRHRLT